MSTSPIDPVSASGANNSSGLNDGPARTELGTGTESLDREAFLKLLVAQLKYQDPTKPADTSQMLTQTAQLTMVDRLNEMAAIFNESAATDRLAVAGTIVGKDISFTDPDGYPVTERADSVRVTDGSLVIQAGEYTVPYALVTAVHAPTDALTTSTPIAPIAPVTTGTVPPSVSPSATPADPPTVTPVVGDPTAPRFSWRP